MNKLAIFLVAVCLGLYCIGKVTGDIHSESVPAANAAAPPEKPLTKKDQIAARKQFAKTIEHEFLMSGMDATFASEGAEGTTLRMTYILVGRPLAEQLGTDKHFLMRCAGFGFKKVILTNGAGASFTFSI